ncbi:hypothetical protein BCM20_003209 [Clostridium beijerinckii]|uniref:hypothetical protein n=1 Tax=Clostridium beijerinckii TaxID=1520 RepID=UPI001494FE66|nr:hypothetical protein [Clostridium beijerinckii]NOW03605.1 hypothetical protein [Clostridium beijerinckii]NYC03254.1 hypothetical protein [Clostridium beijerinckii]
MSFFTRSVSKPLISPNIVANRTFGGIRAYNIPSLIFPPAPGKAGKSLSPTISNHEENPIELLDFVESDLLSYMKEELTNMKESTASIQNALNCIENSKHISVLKALLGDYGSVHFLERLKREIPFDGLDLNFQEYDFLKPYLIEFYISTSLSLFRLWIKQEKDLSSEEFFKLVDTLYKNGITPYSKK